MHVADQYVCTASASKQQAQEMSSLFMITMNVLATHNTIVARLVDLFLVDRRLCVETNSRRK